MFYLFVLIYFTWDLKLKVVRSYHRHWQKRIEWVGSQRLSTTEMGHQLEDRHRLGYLLHFSYSLKDDFVNLQNHEYLELFIFKLIGYKNFLNIFHSFCLDIHPYHQFFHLALRTMIIERFLTVAHLHGTPPGLPIPLVILNLIEVSYVT